MLWQCGVDIDRPELPAQIASAQRRDIRVCLGQYVGRQAFQVEFRKVAVEQLGNLVRRIVMAIDHRRFGKHLTRRLFGSCGACRDSGCDKCES